MEPTTVPSVPPNEFIKTIYERRSIRSFVDRDVPDDLITACLKAANKAPSAHNQQSWRFIVVRGQKKKELSELIVNRAAGFPKASAALLRMAARSITSAPVVVAVANTGELIEHGKRLFAIDEDKAVDFFRTMEIQSSAAAVENLLLAATSLGLATVWLGIMYLIKDEVLELLGEPKGEFMAIVPVGYTSRETSGPQKKKLDVIVKRFN
ncbi:MAG: nitroreductase family protein [Spirochaetes bacterium]|nr:nitroreductase family protein [Spirochaetota bacterium]